ncbi:macrophage colony-stimulating factor 1 isoform X2 [Hirundo rustica]|uniref:macrophage colony-stimulating factor 1 isoform X2 n=1 Tax=Hirundo rustica TaxID=43150 RepID=UPI001A94D584|nr:macrophage colony-stimulating factor 1 isoform X2 [Hirundo rustica]
MPHLGAKVCLLRCSLLSSLLLLLLLRIHETEQNSYCQQIITERHLAELEELADTQMQHPGRVSFKFIDKMQLNDSVCYVKAAFPLMGRILERTEFKENSSNARKMQTVRRMYNSIDENVDPCIREEDDEERTLSQMCFKEFTTSPYEMLVLVKDFFQDIKRLLQNQETFEKDCSRVYRRACPGPRKAGSSPAASCLSFPWPSLQGECCCRGGRALCCRPRCRERPCCACVEEMCRCRPRVGAVPCPCALGDVKRGWLAPASVGTDPDCNCLSPALPSATQPSLSAAAGRDVAPASTRVPSSLLHATLADLEAPSQPPSSTDGGSGTEEVLGAGVGDPALALAPGMKRTAPAGSAEALKDPAGTLSLALGDVPVLRGDGELVEWGTGHLPQDPGQQWGGSILPDQPGGLGIAPRTASPSAGSTGGGARIRPAAAAEPVTQLRFSRMAPELRAPGSPGDRARAWGWGLSRLRDPEDGGGAGPSFDSGFVLGAEQRRKEPPVREGRQEPLIYITVASVVAVLLATGGLLFYKYKSRVLERPLEDGGCDPEEPERRAPGRM